MLAIFLNLTLSKYSIKTAPNLGAVFNMPILKPSHVEPIPINSEIF